MKHPYTTFRLQPLRAVLVILAVSLFCLAGIYAASATPLEKKADSSGAYVLFRSGGTERAVRSLPLDKERTQSDTRDISASSIGFATFDEVPTADVPVHTMLSMTLEELEETLSQSLLVSLYYH